MQDGQLEAPDEHPKKMKLFFIHEVENWDADFYSKVNDDVHVNIGMSLLFPGIENIACACNLQFF